MSLYCYERNTLDLLFSQFERKKIRLDILLGPQQLNILN